MTRANISKGIRFEVFKRDCFTCQYCGAKAPDVLLVIDHIEPVAKGGTNDILNLITACQPCNSGKSDKRLTDTSVLDKQREQLENLQERKEQIEMMFQWQKSLTDLDGHILEQLALYWSELVPPYGLNQNGLSSLKKLFKRFGIEDVMESMRIAVDQYVEYEEGKPTQESVEISFNKIGGICTRKKQFKDKPYMKDLFYMRGIMRNRFRYCNEHIALRMLEECVLLGADVDSLRNLALNARNWTEWRSEVESFINREQSEENETTDASTETAPAARPVVDNEEGSQNLPS